MKYIRQFEERDKKITTDSRLTHWAEDQRPPSIELQGWDLPQGYSQPSLELKKYWLFHPLLELRSPVIKVRVGSRLVKYNHPGSFSFGQ